MAADDAYLYDEPMELHVLAGLFCDERLSSNEFQSKWLSLFGSAVPSDHQVKDARKLFTNRTSRAIFDAIVSAVRKHGKNQVLTPDIVYHEIPEADRGYIVADSSKGDPNVVSLRKEVVSAAMDPGVFSSSVETLRRLSILRSLDASLGEMKDAVREGNDIDSILDDIHRLSEVAASAKEVTLETPRQKMQRIREAASSGTLIRTGFKGIDDVLRGFEEGRLYVIGARPKVGKSLLTTNLVLNAMEQGAWVLLFSLEMMNKEVLSRMISAHSMVSVSKVWGECMVSNKLPSDYPEDPELREASESEQAISAYDRLILVSRDDNDDMSFPSITARINKVAQLAKSENRPMLVIIDYLQLLVEDKSNSNAEVSQITSTLKKLALASGAAIVLNSQLNRSGADTEPHSWMLRDSGAIEQDADVVMVLDRPSTRDPEAPQHLMVVNIELSRYSQSGKVNLEYLPDFGALSDMDDSNNMSTRAQDYDDDEELPDDD